MIKPKNKPLTDSLRPPMEIHKSFLNIKPRKDTKYIVVHCSASQPKADYDWKSIDQVHRARGFLTIGYHYVICTDGRIQNGRNIDALGAHASGYNDHSISICLVGGVDRAGKSCNNFTKEQFNSLAKLINWLKYIYYNEDPVVLGHRDLPDVHKDCPCFDVKPFYAKVKNTYFVYEGTDVTNFSKADFARINGTPHVGDLLVKSLGRE